MQRLVTGRARNGSIGGASASAAARATRAAANASPAPRPLPPNQHTDHCLAPMCRQQAAMPPPPPAARAVLKRPPASPSGTFLEGIERGFGRSFRPPSSGSSSSVPRCCESIRGRVYAFRRFRPCSSAHGIRSGFGSCRRLGWGQPHSPNWPRALRTEPWTVGGSSASVRMSAHQIGCPSRGLERLIGRLLASVFQAASAFSRGHRQPQPGRSFRQRIVTCPTGLTPHSKAGRDTPPSFCLLCMGSGRDAPWDYRGIPPPKDQSCGPTASSSDLVMA